MPDETFTDFMIRCMTAEESVQQALVIVRRGDGTVGYKAFQQQFADSIGLLRLTQMSVENDLIQEWKGE